MGVCCFTCGRDDATDNTLDLTDRGLALVLHTISQTCTDVFTDAGRVIVGRCELVEHPAVVLACFLDHFLGIAGHAVLEFLLSVCGGQACVDGLLLQLGQHLRSLLVYGVRELLIGLALACQNIDRLLIVALHYSGLGVLVVADLLSVASIVFRCVVVGCLLFFQLFLFFFDCVLQLGQSRGPGVGLCPAVGHSLVGHPGLICDALVVQGFLLFDQLRLSVGVVALGVGQCCPRLSTGLQCFDILRRVCFQQHIGLLGFDSFVDFTLQVVVVLHDAVDHLDLGAQGFIQLAQDKVDPRPIGLGHLTMRTD